METTLLVNVYRADFKTVSFIANPQPRQCWRACQQVKGVNRIIRWGGTALATLIAMGIPSSAQVTDLMLNRSGNDITLNWTTGTSPYRVLRSLTPTFMSGNTVVADGLSGGSATDVGAALTPELYFYQVVGSGDPSPGLFDLNPPRPVPGISTLTPSSGQPGTVVTIDGFGYADLGSGMIVMFGDIPADVISATTTQIMVTAPPGTVTSDVVVCVADVCSNPMPFSVTVGPSFQNISSLAFEGGTGSLWIGDRGTADAVIEIDSAGTVTTRANLAESFVSNPSPGDGTGRIYFSNGTVSTANQGTIRYINSSDNSNNFFRAAGAGTTDPVWVRGLAARDSETDVCYFLDGNNNTVRRVPGIGTIDTNWGNTVFSFNNPAGGRFDSAGNLYVSSTTAIYKIATNETVTLVASGFAGAAGMDLSEDTGIPTLLVADKAAGQVYLVNTESGTKEVVGQGFTNPVAAAFTRDLATGELFYDVAEPTRILRLPDPRVHFTLKDATPVLIHKYRPEDRYPTALQTEDRKIVIEANVINSARPVAGVTVYLRLIDPDDKAPYASTGANDNKGGPGTLSVTSAVSDSSGKVRTTLTVTDTFTGDNYQVEASLQPPATFKKIARSPVFTAWKRAYVEYDRMYKVGQFINQTSGAGQADPTKVFVANPAAFVVGEQVHVLSGDTNTTAEGEKRTVAAIGADHIVLNTALANSYPYTGPSPPGDSFPYSFVAKVSASAYEVNPSSMVLSKAFDDPFTEWKFVDGGSFLPSWPTIQEASLGSFINARTEFFFKNFKRTPSPSAPLTNHIQLVAAGATDAGTVKGDTLSDNPTGEIAPNWSWVFKDNITAACVGCTGTQVQNFVEDVTAHESGHQWNVNKPQDPNGHDAQNTWNDASRKCLMNETRDPTLGVVRFHANLVAPSKDLYCIRGHTDDLNQDTCTW